MPAARAIVASIAARAVPACVMSGIVRPRGAEQVARGRRRTPGDDGREREGRVPAYGCPRGSRRTGSGPAHRRNRHRRAPARLNPNAGGIGRLCPRSSTPACPGTSPAPDRRAAELKVIAHVSRRPRRALVRAVSRARDASADHRHILRGAVRFPVLEAGATAYELGGECANYLMCIEGRTRVFRISAGGREMLIYRVGPRGTCVLTTQCLLAGGTFPAESVAEQRTVLAALPAETFRHLMAASAAFRAFVLDELRQAHGRPVRAPRRDRLHAP